MKKYLTINQNITVFTNSQNEYIGTVKYVNNSVLSLEYFDFNKKEIVTFEGFKVYEVDTIEKQMLCVKTNALGINTHTIYINY